MFLNVSVQIMGSLKNCEKWPKEIQAVWKSDLPKRFNYKKARFLANILVISTDSHHGVYSVCFNTSAIFCQYTVAYRRKVGSTILFLFSFLLTI